jgi:hypothetical protein
MSDPSDARERLLAFVERVEREHSEFKVRGLERGLCDLCCDAAGDARDSPCDAARAAAAIRAIAGHFRPESRAWSDANVQVLLQVGADALGKE